MTLTENLINLFQVESQVRGLQSRLDAAERYLNAQNRLLKDLLDQRQELESRRRQVQATVANLENETATLDQRIEKLRDELNSSTTNKQYSAVLTELNTVKVARSELEDRILEEMERIEQGTAELDKLAGEIQEREKVKKVAESDLAIRHEEIGERLAELETERDGAAAAVPTAELKIFNEMADAYDGEAMATIEEIDRRHREYSCGACNIILPFEAVAALLGSSEVMVRCTACGRILYLHEEMRGALTKD